MNRRYIDRKRNNHSYLYDFENKLFMDMVQNNQSIFKLLKYDNPKIIDHKDDEDYYMYHELDIDKPDLTDEEKIDMLYKANDDSSSYNIQFIPMTDDAVHERQCKLHMYVSGINPNPRNGQSYLNGSIVTTNFEVVCHNKFAMVNNGHNHRVF